MCCSGFTSTFSFHVTHSESHFRLFNMLVKPSVFVKSGFLFSFHGKADRKLDIRKCAIWNEPCYFWRGLYQNDYVFFLVWSSEPNSYEKKAGIRVDGCQLGQDFTRLRKMMSEFKVYKNATLYGPDISQPRDHRTDILEGWEFVSYKYGTVS